MKFSDVYLFVEFVRRSPLAVFTSTFTELTGFDNTKTGSQQLKGKLLHLPTDLQKPTLNLLLMLLQHRHKPDTLNIKPVNLANRVVSFSVRLSLHVKFNTRPFLLSYL